jgi:short-chain fatty acids transporter
MAASSDTDTGSLPAEPGLLQRAGLWLAAAGERWFPDALVFAFLGVVIVFVLGLLLGESPANLAGQGGAAFWTLVPFTMQMAMVIIGGYVVASSPPVHRAIAWLARMPRSGRGAIALVALFSTLSSLISWGFSLIFSGLLVRALSRRVKDLDYRAAGAAAYLGLGAVWALGLSSSAALMMATRTEGVIPADLLKISGVIPLSQTIFLWPSMIMAAILVVLSTAIAYWSAPSTGVRTVESYDVSDAPLREQSDATRPGDWLEQSPVVTIPIVAVLAVAIARTLHDSPRGALAALDLNTYNLIFITLGLLLHWRPRSFSRAVADAVPAIGGVVIQFPFYAVIFGMITKTGIADWLAQLFARVSTPGSFPLLVAAYSAVLGIFIPSGGSKWIVEAPYVLKAASLQHVHLGWVVQIYNAAEALPNLINPFWMLPLLGLLRLKARDLVGFTMLQLLLLAPIVFFLCWFFARWLPYVPPIR